MSSPTPDCTGRSSTGFRIRSARLREAPMDNQIRVLLIDDITEDAELISRELRKGSLEIVTHRVDCESSLRSALSDFAPQIILSDYNLPEFGGTRALEIAKEHSPDVPFIFVSGTIG